MIGKLLAIFDRHEKIHAGFLLAMLVIGAGLETVGIGLIFPFISILNDPDIITRQPTLAGLHHYLALESPRQFLIIASLALLGLYLFKNTFLAVLNYAQFKFIFGKQADIAGKLFTAYLRAPYVFHLQRNSAEIVRNFSTEIGGLFTGVITPLFALAAESLVLLAILTFLIFVEPAVTLITIAVIALTALGFHFLIGSYLRAGSERRAANSALQIKWVNQSIGSLREIRILGKESFFIEAFRQASGRYARAARLFSTVNTFPRLILETLATCGLLLIVLAITLREESLQAATPMLAMFGMAALRILPSITRMMSAVSSIRFYRPALDAVLKDLALAQGPRPVAQPSTPSTPVPAVGRFPFTAKIEVRDLAFRYPGADRWAVNNPNIEISKGSSVAFVGFSGSGKSTLVDLILGLLTPSQGEILVDGVDMQSALPAWQCRFGYVPQTIYLLDDSVRRNIAFGFEDRHIDDDKVWRVLSAAQLEGKFRNQPQGLDTTVGERGVRLSGGERQRIGIARALFHDPEILVFDEATSALDHQTEREIAETINSLRMNKTLIIVAHRLTSVMHCDRIYFMKDGTVVDAGTFGELVARNHDFRIMTGEGS